jgi:hypothetical protein
LGNLGPLTERPGDYVLTLTALGAGIEDTAGNQLATGAVEAWSDIREAGDANEDGQFSFDDIFQVLGSAKYETGLPARWGEGDWTGDGFFSFDDIFAALSTGNYETGPYVAAGAAEAALERTALDGLFAGLAAGKYETGVAASRDEGDWSGDGVFDFRDVLSAMADGRAVAAGQRFASQLPYPLVRDAAGVYRTTKSVASKSQQTPTGCESPAEDARQS